MKKAPFPVLIAIIVLQLVVPTALICHGLNIERNIDEKGKEYKIAIELEAIHDGVIEFYIKDDDYGFYYSHGSSYAEIITGENGISTLRSVEKDEIRPKEYINVTDPEKFPMKCEMQTDKVFFRHWYTQEERVKMNSYVTVNIYKGECKVKDIYINGISLTDYLGKAPSANPDDLGYLFDDDKNNDNASDNDDFENLFENNRQNKNPDDDLGDLFE